MEKLSKDLNQIREEMYQNINNKQKEYASKGWLPVELNLNKGIARGLIELWCFCLYQLYQHLEKILKQAFPSTATGNWLDLHCIQVSVKRREETRTKGKVNFHRKDSKGNLVLKKGLILKTKPDALGKIYRFITTEKKILIEGVYETDVQVIAEEPGAGSNVIHGQITELTTNVTGIDRISNMDNWIISEGADRENDDDLRERYFLAWAQGAGSNKYAYLSWVKSIPGVVSAKILDQHPYGEGSVGVVIRGSAGIPTDELKSKVRMVIDRNRPINDKVRIIGPDPVDIEIEGRVQIESGNHAEIKKIIENKIRNYFSYSDTQLESNYLEIGEDINIAKISSLVMEVEGVKNVKLTKPLEDINVSDNGLGILKKLSITISTEDI